MECCQRSESERAYPVAGGQFRSLVPRSLHATAHRSGNEFKMKRPSYSKRLQAALEGKFQTEAVLKFQTKDVENELFYALHGVLRHSIFTEMPPEF